MSRLGIRFSLAAALTLVAAATCHASTVPALQLATVPDVQVIEGDASPAPLRSVLAAEGSGPIILLPIYTRCSASCPILTRKLETALAAMKSTGPYRVIVVSFDPLETAESLRLYREHEHVPTVWKIVRASDDEIRNLFGFFRYSVMNQEGTLLHPNEIFLLDNDLKWRWTVVGEDWTPQELATVIEQTRSPGLVANLRARPEALAWAGFAGVILGFGLAIGWLLFRKPSRQPIPAH